MSGGVYYKKAARLSPHGAGVPAGVSDGVLRPEGTDPPFAAPPNATIDDTMARYNVTQLLHRAVAV